MSNPYESPRSTDMEAENHSAEATALPTILLTGSLFALASFSNQVATFWGCIDPQFRTNGSLVASFVFGAAFVAIFAFGLGAFCGWLAPARRSISLKVAALSLLPIALPATALFGFFASSHWHHSYNSLFIALYFTALLQGIGLCLVSMRYLKRWAILPLGAALSATGGGLVGLYYYLIIMSGV